jgi:hypothetical protein
MPRIAGQQASRDFMVDSASRDRGSGEHAGHGREAHCPEQDRVAEEGGGQRAD